MSRQLSIEELRALVGTTIGCSEWVRVDQERIDLFAAATGDHSVIHVDPEASARTPMGCTIAHGYLTLALLPVLGESINVVPARNVIGINEAVEEARFLRPVCVDSDVRVRVRLLRVAEPKPRQVVLTNEHIVEVRGEPDPVLVAVTRSRYLIR